MEFEISLNNLRFYANHGVLEEETKLGNEFIVDLSVKLLCIEYPFPDELRSTVSYADLYEIVVEEMKQPRKLLENVAYSIVSRIREKYKQVNGGFIRIEKVRPPIPGMIGSASVRLNF